MSNYLNRMMLADERVIYATQLHWVVYLHGFFVLVMGAAFGFFSPFVVAYLMGPETAKLAVLPIKIFTASIIAYGAIQLIVDYIKQISTELVITNRRVVAKYGFVSTTTFELMMTKVEGANIDQTVMGRLLGYGTVLVKGTGGGISPIDNIDDPYGFHSCLMQVMQQAQQPNPPQMAPVGQHD